MVPYHFLTLFFYQITITLSSAPTNYITSSSITKFFPPRTLSKEAPRSVRLTISVEPGTGPSPIPCLASVTVSPLLALESITQSPTPPLVGNPGLQFSEAINAGSKGLPQLPLTDNLLAIIENPLQSDILRGPRALPTSSPSSESKPPLIGFSRFTPFSRQRPVSVVEADSGPLIEYSLPSNPPNVLGTLDEQSHYVRVKGNPYKKQLNNPNFNMQALLCKRMEGLKTTPENSNLLESEFYGGSQLLQQPNHMSNIDDSLPAPLSTIAAGINFKIKDDCLFNKGRELHHKKPLNIKSETDDIILSVESLAPEALKSFEYPSNTLIPPINTLPTETICPSAFSSTLLNTPPSPQPSPNKIMPFSISKNLSPPLSCIQTSRLAPVDKQINPLKCNLNSDNDLTKTVNTKSNLQSLETGVINLPSVPINLETVETEISILNSPYFLKVNQKPEFIKDNLPRNNGVVTLPSISKEAASKLFPSPIQSPIYLPNPYTVSECNIGLPSLEKSTLETASKFCSTSCIDQVKSSVPRPYISSITINVIPYIQEDESEIIILL